MNSIVSGIQQAAAAGVTSLPSRDIPMNQNRVHMDQQADPNYVPENKFSLKFLLSYAVKNANTTVYTGQTDAGFNIDNPYSFNEKLNYKIQLDYVL